MGLVCGSHCVLWASLAALLYAGPANPDREVKTALAHSDAALASPDLSAARPDPDASDALADPVVEVALAKPETNVSSLEASDECLAAEDCVDRYLWSVYEPARKVDTHQVKERIKGKGKNKGQPRNVPKTVT